VWTQGAADPELGLVYYGTGNAVPVSGVTIKIDKPGTYAYFAKEFPWAKGQLVVR
jgi:glucose dehydrogenase